MISTITGPASASPAIGCVGLPHPRSSNACDAGTDARGSVLFIHVTSALIASMVCARARSRTSFASLGLPPGLPLLPFSNLATCFRPVLRTPCLIQNDPLTHLREIEPQLADLLHLQADARFEIVQPLAQ